MPWSGEIEVEFDIEAMSPADLVLTSEAALRVARGSTGDGASTGFGTFPAAGSELARGSSCDLLVAAGSMLLAVIGLVVPGIPAVPFLMLGCEFLSRGYPPSRSWLDSIPAIRQRLSNSARDGRPWNDPLYLGKCLALCFLTAAFFLVIHPPLPIVLAFELGLMFFSG
jgi:uncharacterized membrane protein YbaN (DUF454 family)